jgi:hypothetical protein
MTLQNLDTLIAFVVLMLGVSLLITVLTQMVTNLLGLRGTNLRRGLVELLTAVHPDLKNHVQDIAQRVLEHPLVSDSVFAGTKSPIFARWRLASAIRVEELVGILNKLSTPAATATSGTVQQAMADIAQKAGVTSSPEMRALVAQVKQLASAVTTTAPATPSPAATVPSPSVSMQLDQITKQVPATVEAKLGDDLRSWFDSAMDRTAQRFTLQARLVTVIVTVFFVFAAHFDALRVLEQLAADPELRAKLVQSADAMQKHAEQVLSTPGASPAPTGPSTTSPASPGDAKAAQAQLEELRKRAEAIKNDLSKTGFQLIADPYPGLRFSAAELPGLLVAWALLSLGAPFWFNALKTLTNLRPLLATKQEKEQERRAA